MTILVTGGAGFIGANFILRALDAGKRVINLDKLSYAGNLMSLQSVAQHERYGFAKGSIGDAALVAELLRSHRVTAVVNFAAESHVDRSISFPEAFVETNVVETTRLLQCAREYQDQLTAADRAAFRFLHVSTDEVFGTLGPTDAAFSEDTAYAPNSPYSASKAASDHFVRAYHETYGLQTLTTNCSNNYGPFQFPEKLIPLVIHNALAGKPLPIYGDGLQVRDWLYVADHCRAILQVLAAGEVGATYNVGGNSEMKNIDVVKTLCAALDEYRPRSQGGSYSEQITFVRDRPGHDRRYAVNTDKIGAELGWAPMESFETGIRKTVQWYLDHPEWVAAVTSGTYRDWIDHQYATGDQA